MQKPDLVYTRKGSGPTLLLLHGIGHRRQIWDPIIDDLATRYDVIAPDLSGFGESPAFAGGLSYSMENAVEHLQGQLDRWGVTKPHVVGNSLGGAIALELGARGAVSSVTALSPAGFFGPVSRFQALIALFFLRFLALASPKPVLHALSRTSWGRKASGMLLYSHPERQDPEAAYGDALSLKHATAFERVAKQALTYRFASQVPVTTTIAWAREDKILPFSQSRVAQQRVASAFHVPLPGCGHVPIIDDPELITRVIDQTVARATPVERMSSDSSRVRAEERLVDATLRHPARPV